MLKNANGKKIIYAVVLLTLCVCRTVWAEGLVFGVVGKTVDDVNFVDTWRGCAEAAKLSGDRCVLLGGRGSAKSRAQERAVSDALATERFDALALSVIHSNNLARLVREADVPIITFDSPFVAEDAHLSRGYVGTDNVQVGRDLARIARKLRPQGGTICMMTALHDANLAQRLQGVRQELSGESDFPGQQRLTGEGGWTELARCPWNAADRPKRVMAQLTFTLARMQPDVFLSVGHWPVVNVDLYRQTVAPFADQLASGAPHVIVAVGKVVPGAGDLLEEKLVHGYVSIDFPTTGKLCYELMKAVVEGDSVAPVTSIPNMVHMVEP